MKYQDFDSEFEDEEPQIKPLTAQEAQAWRQRQPKLSMWKMWALQVLVGAVVAVLLALVAGAAAGWSAAYGALAIVLPSALFVRGVARNSGSAASAPGAMARLFVWEFVKLVLTIALLLAAPKVVPHLNWLALLAGLVITMKTYWVALMVRPGARKSDSQH